MPQLHPPTAPPAGAPTPAPESSSPAPSATAAPPPVAWSVTRSRLLRECARAVYWQYHARGWRADASPEARFAFAVKTGLTTIPLLVGIAVHNAARELVAAARDRRTAPTYDALLAGARLTLNTAWRNAQPDRVAHFWRWPAAYPALQEVVYGGPLEQAAAEGARLALAACLRHLVASPVLTDVAACAPEDVRLGGAGPERLLVPLGPRDHSNAGPGAPVPTTVTAWVAPDAAYRHGEPATARVPGGSPVSGAVWTLVEWKTGTPSPDVEDLQLAAQALLLQSQGVPTTDGCYLGRVVYLRGGTERWTAITAADLAGARAVIAGDVARETALVVDALRPPAPAAPGLVRNAADAVTRVPLAPDERRRWCPRCRYFPLCRDALAAADSMPGDGGGAAPGPGEPASAPSRSRRGRRDDSQPFAAGVLRSAGAATSSQ